ncbi:MAG: hypothetical protein LH615_06105, partial [Ferruginibacter sp.]|nr:hypothetical protein [Ferruginibacter sp.]
MIKQLIFLLLLLPSFVYAHGDEDHEKDKTAVAKTVTYFSSEATSGLYELLVKYKNIQPGKEAILKLYVSNFSTNKYID